MQLEKPPILQSEPVKPKAKAHAVARAITFSGPTGELPGYMGRRIDLAQLTAKQQRSIYTLWAGLVRDGAKLQNGTPVKAPSHAVKWMLENCVIE